jgi:hypothetical protein
MKVIYVTSLIALLATGCNYGDTVVAGGDTLVTPSPTPSPGDKIVCDPFNTQNPALLGHGLQAKMAYLSDDQPRYNLVMDNINYGHPIEANVFLNDVNVPTRPFDRGFFTQSGSLVVNTVGMPIYEYFSVDMQSTVVLGPNDPVGTYQFAILADDGAILEVQDTSSGFRTLISADGAHPTMMGCEADPIALDNNSQLPIKFHYFQGPRYHIALMLLWRLMPADPAQVTDSLCGASGNALFFDPNVNPSNPQQAFLDLQSRGWHVLTPQNFLLPGASGTVNPCAASSAPVISGLRVDNVTQNTADVTWTTDVASTTQVGFEISTATAYSFTVQDQTPSTNHTVHLTALQNFGYYSVYGMSANGGAQSVSNILSFRTLR